MKRRSKDMTNYDERHSIILEHESALELKFNEGIEIGKEEGIEIGKEERTITIARNFKNMGIPIDQIAKASGLTEEEIEKL